MEKDEKQRLYFILKTNGQISVEALRTTESVKIECGKVHFKALGTEVEFNVVGDFDRFVEGI